MATEFYNRNWRMPNSWNGSTDNNNKVSNYSMSFDGSSERIVIPYSDIFNQSVYSISLWIKNNSNSTGGDDGILCADSGTRGWALQQNSQVLKLTPNISSGGSTVLDSDFFNTTSTWIHCALTFDGTDLILYKNGVSAATQSSGTLTLNANNNDLTIGDNQFAAGREFNGKIDHVAIFDYALSASQITTLYGNSTNGVGNPMSLSAKPKAFYAIGDYAAFNGSEYLVNNGALQDYVFNFTTTSSPHNKITVNNLSVLNQSSKLSFSGWINLQDVSRFQNILNIFDTTGVNRIAVNTFNNTIRFNVNRAVSGNSYNQLSISSLVGDGDWFHFATVFDGTFTASPVSSQNQGRLKFYINGQNYVPNYLSGSVPSSIGDLGSSSFLEIGNNSGSQPSFLGMANNIAFWNTNLSSSQITELYNNGTPYTGTQPESSNLQGWWKLDASATFDGSNWSIPDSSSNSNTGTSNNMTAANLVQSNLLITQPYSRYALSFDGTNDYIDCGNTNAHSTISVSLWFKATTAATYERIIQKGNNTGGSIIGYGIAFSSSSNKIEAWYRVGTTQYASKSTTTINTGTWYNVIFTYNNDSVAPKLYINGTLEPTLAGTSGNFGSSSDDLNIGRKAGANAALFNGSISNCSLWNNVLTSSQVTEIYNQGKPSNLNNHSAYSNLVSWWQLGENSSFDGTNWTVLDEKGTNNGTSANMTEADLVNGVGTSGNGLSDGMGGADNIVGDAPYSTGNAVSYGMGVDAKSTDVPS